jgi:hypothetical protein
LILENAGFLTPSQTERHVKALDFGSPRECLAAEWEAAILNGFSKTGHVACEPDFGGRCFADLYVTPAGWPEGAFLADVRTVSDRSLHDDNPIDDFIEAYLRVVEKRRLATNRFSCRIAGHASADRDTTRKRLQLPDKGRQLSEVLSSDRFRIWMDGIRSAPDLPHEITMVAPGVDIRFGYDPGQRHFSFGYPSYRTVAPWDYAQPERGNREYSRSPAQRQLWNALDAKKDQLKRTGFDGPLGVIVCDGGCHILRHRQAGGNGAARHVIERFLRDSPSIAFVMAATIEYPELLSLRDPYIQPAIIYNAWVEEGFQRDLSRCVDAAFKAIPRPEAGADNALAWLAQPGPRQGRSFQGGWRMTSFTDGTTEIRISARALLALLAGNESSGAFLQAHEMVPPDGDGEGRDNPFAEAARVGRLISGVALEASADKDDDWVTIRIGPVDPAVSRLTTPA